jgi:hypothetical protein
MKRMGHTSLEVSGKGKLWGRGVMNNKWLNIDEEKSYKKIIRCRETGELEHLGKCLYRRICKRGSIGN